MSGGFIKDMSGGFINDIVAEADIPVEGTLSRVLVKQDTVRLVVFAFDAGQVLTEHTASVPAIVQVVTGALSVTVGGEEHHMTPASWLYLPAGEPHSVRADAASRMLLTMIRCP
jgi:quercetin dioxygenase-like cupin family protein